MLNFFKYDDMDKIEIKNDKLLDLSYKLVIMVKKMSKFE